MPVAIAAVAIIGGVATAVVQKQAADKAAAAQRKAIDQQQEILRKKLDPGALNLLAQQMDKERAQSRLELQREVDPEIAALRDFSKQQLLKLAQQAPETRRTEQVTRQLFEENIRPDERMERIKDTIIARAQEDFDAGATLPPEFQAELVRTGIQAGSRAGVGVSDKTVGGTTSRLLGGAGIALKQQRAAEGAALATTADSLAQSRQRLLANIFPTVAAQEQAEIQRATGGLAIAESLLPESGLSGTQGVDIELARRKAQMNLQAQRGNVGAQQAIARGQAVAQGIGSVTSGLTSGLGGGIGGGGGQQQGPPPGAALAGATYGANYGSVYGNVIGPGGAVAGAQYGARQY